MITLTTIVYEGNFIETLNNDCWFFKFNSELITHKLIVVNNLTSTENFWSKIEQLRVNNSFDIVMVDGNESFANRLFSLGIDKTTIGYVYTMPYFVLLSAISTPFILNVATDCMSDIFVDDEFLNKAINEINTNPLCSTVMVSWVKDNHTMGNGLTVGQHEENETTSGLSNKNFNYTKGFTDQFFIGKLEHFKKIDYNIDSSYSNTYNGPLYGGNCFEKRVIGHMNYNNIYNCVFKGKQYYIHNNHYY
jgi:hypothetical protein